MSKKTFGFLIIFLIVFGFLVFKIKKKPQELEVKASPGTTWQESCQVTKGGCFCRSVIVGYECGGSLSCTPSCLSRQNATYADPSSTCIYNTVGTCHVGDSCGFEAPNPAICWAGTNCSFAGGNCEYTCESGFENCDNNGPANGCECEKPAGCCDGNIRRYDCDICYGVPPTTCNKDQACVDRVDCLTQDCGEISYCSGGYCATCPGNFLNCNGNPVDGCELDVSADNNNCGGCGPAYGGPPEYECDPLTENCINGLCVSTGIADVWGWAWSENIGWISFNSSNCDSDEDGFSVGDPPGCPGTVASPVAMSNYGINIDSGTGDFSGFAWSENIGWIRFDPPPDFATGLYPNCPFTTCPDGSPNHFANLNLTTKKATGWARACAGTVNGDCASATRTDGWDGWILLGPIFKASEDFGVNYVSTCSGELHNWAWGSNVVGWISFWGSNPTIPSPSGLYVVSTDLAPPNERPYVQVPQITNEDYCSTSPTGHVQVQWTYKDDDGDDQEQYHLQVSTVDFSDLGFGPEDLVVDSINPQTVSPDGTGTSVVSVERSPTPDPTDRNVGYNQTYYWRVRVKAATGSPLWSDWVEGPSFDTPLHAYPRVNFEPVDGAKLPFDSGEVQFCSIFESGICETEPAEGWTTCYDASNNPITCTGSGPCGSSWCWTFWGGTPDTSIDPNPLVTYSAAGDKQADLTVTDSDGYTCTTTHNFTLTPPLTLPKWKEIPPF